MNMSEDGSYVGNEVWYNGTYVYPVLYLMKQTEFPNNIRLTEVDFEYQYIPIHDDILMYITHQDSRYEYGVRLFDPLDRLWRVFYMKE
jgi:hypothetical protein